MSTGRSSYSQTKSTDEECLFANVTTPSVAGRKPVMVWIHGDGAIGAGHYFDASRLARQGDVVVVTFNYRMGGFGGFGLPGLEHSGEFGLLDQRAALEWVQRNISAFGGDPGNVTLFGVSFGATAVGAHLIGQQRLFHRAIMHSSFTLVDVPKGAWYPDLEALPSLAWRPVAEIQEIGTMITRELGCADVECLRQLPVEKLLEYPQIMNIFQPVGYGGALLPKLPAESLEAGEFADVPILAGATRDEHNSFVGLFRPGPMSMRTGRHRPGRRARDRAGHLRTRRPPPHQGGESGRRQGHRQLTIEAAARPETASRQLPSTAGGSSTGTRSTSGRMSTWARSTIPGLRSPGEGDADQGVPSRHAGRPLVGARRRRRRPHRAAPPPTVNPAFATLRGG